MEHIEGSDRAAECHHLVPHVARYAVHIARTKNPALPTDRELGRPFQHHAHLLVRMVVLRHEGTRLHVYDRQHQPASPDSVDTDSGEDVMTGGIPFSEKVITHGSVPERRGRDYTENARNGSREIPGSTVA